MSNFREEVAAVWARKHFVRAQGFSMTLTAEEVRTGILSPVSLADCKERMGAEHDAQELARKEEAVLRRAYNSSKFTR
jgi:hypothetical protein